MPGAHGHAHRLPAYTELTERGLQSRDYPQLLPNESPPRYRLWIMEKGLIVGPMKSP